MPSNRRPIPAAKKRAQIIAAAQTFFVDEGYESVSISRIAKQAGVTSNTIYWYFKDKDELLVAVLNEILKRNIIRLQKVKNDPLADQLFWVVQTLKKMKRLILTLHSRVQFSEELNQWHKQFHVLADGLIESNLSNPLPSSERNPELMIVTFSIEGLISHDVDEVAARKICKALARKLEMLTT